jgi:hypothetical protein
MTVISVSAAEISPSGSDLDVHVKMRRVVILRYHCENQKHASVKIDKSLSGSSYSVAGVTPVIGNAWYYFIEEAYGALKERSVQRVGCHSSSLRSV